jgi:hypothetical protein
MLHGMMSETVASMRQNMIANLATAAFFAVLAIGFLLGFLAGLDWPLLGRATSILFAVLFGGLAYRLVWGMRHGE